MLEVVAAFKAAALKETLRLDGRLTAPRIHGAEAGWGTALDLIAERFSRTIADRGPGSVAFYVSGQLLTEAYCVATKLMQGIIGSATIDTNSRLCMASLVAGHRRAFGSDTVPGQYDHLAQADLVVLVGCNLAWGHPVRHQRLMAARAVRVDHRDRPAPHRDLRRGGPAPCHRPGADALLFKPLVCHLADHGSLNPDFLRHVTGRDAAIAATRQASIADTRLAPGDLAAFLTFGRGRKRWSPSVPKASALPLAIRGG